MGRAAGALGRGSRAAAHQRRAVPAGDVAMLLQTIVGAWPLDLDPGDRAGRTAFAERLAAWQQKALREAKLFTDWAAVDESLRSCAHAALPWR